MVRHEPEDLCVAHSAEKDHSHLSLIHWAIFFASLPELSEEA